MKLYFDGKTYDPTEDKFRLLGALQKVWVVMLDGDWHTLEELHHITGNSEACVSARIRDFRKARFGGHSVERRRVSGGLFEYKLEPNGSLIIGE